MRKMILYTNPMSRGITVLQIIAETGLAVEIKNLEFAELKSAEYLSINPMAKVPALKYGDTVITETAAICLFLAELAPEKHLIPQDLATKASFYRWLFFSQTFEYAMMESALNIQVPESARRSIGYGSLARVLNTLKQQLTTQQYLANNQFSLADILITNNLFMGMHRFNSIPADEALLKYMENIMQRPSYEIFKQFKG